MLHEWEYDIENEPKKVINSLGEVSFDKTEPIQNLITWIYEDGSFVPCAKLTENSCFSIINDYIGRPIQAYDDVGNLVWSAEYDIYGGLKKIKGEKDFIPFRQLGQYEDVETGLYYNRFRYYDPASGLYISKDPISILGGLNVYAYVWDSNTQVDVFGWVDIWYRALNMTDISNLDAGIGIIAKDPNAQNSIVNHINFGSEKWYKDQYISLTKNQKLAEKWAKLSNTEVIKIDLDKVTSNKYDLSTNTGRKINILESVGNKHKDKLSAMRLSEMMEELLVEKKINMDAILSRYKPKYN